MIFQFFPHFGNLQLVICGNHIGGHVRKPIFIGKCSDNSLLDILALVEAGFYFCDFYPLAINHNLVIFAVQECNIPVRQDIAQVTAAVHDAAIRLLLENLVFFRMVANISQRDAIPINTDFTGLAFWHFVPALIENPDLRTQYRMPDRVSAIFQNRTAVAAVVGGADRRLRRAVGVINFRFVQQMIHIDAPQYIAAADEQAQGGRDLPQMVHLCQQIKGTR